MTESGNTPNLDALAYVAPRAAIDAALAEFLAHQRTRMSSISPELSLLDGELAEFMQGGKRLRPLFAYWGWRLASETLGEPIREAAVIRAVAALEWLHTSALIHDDVMDGSDTRRGRPSAHRAFAQQHSDAKWAGSPTAFGEATAILLGDLCLVWSAEMLNGSGIPYAQLTSAQSLFDTMRTEVILGQYLDVAGHAIGDLGAERAHTTLLYKSAKYTVEQPVLIGAALAGAVSKRGGAALAGAAGDLLPRALSEYGIALGKAFQLRDDVLGVFGDPAATGKPAGDDLRQGKHTLLIAVAAEKSKPQELGFLRTNLGDPSISDETLDQLRQHIVGTGALAEIEHTIEKLTAQALSALDEVNVSSRATDALREMAQAATNRTA